MNIKNILLAFVIGVFAHKTQAASGSLNINFNPSGSITTVLGGGATPGFWYINSTSSNTLNITSIGRCVTMQGQKILFGGSVETTSSVFKSFVLRLNPNGTIDTTFGTGGIVLIDTAFFGGSLTIGTTNINNVESMVVQPDNKIVLSTYNVIGGTARFCVVRLLENGGRDTTFNPSPYTDPVPGYGGTVPGIWYLTGTTAPFTAISISYGIALQADGKIIVAGTGNSSILIVRLTADGRRDRATFNASGAIPGMWYKADVPTSPTNIQTAYFVDSTTARGQRGIGIQSNGKIVVAVQFRSTTPALTRAGVLRLTPDGVIDPDFNTAGSSTIGGTIPGYFVFLTASNTTLSTGECLGMSIQSDNKILVTGYIYYGTIAQTPFCMRLTADGALDTTFNAAGSNPYGGTTPGVWAFSSVTDSIFNQSGGVASDILFDRLGRILLVGIGRRSTPNPILQGFVARFTSAGVLDTTFTTAAGTYVGTTVPGISTVTAGPTAPFPGNTFSTEYGCATPTGQVLLASRVNSTNRAVITSINNNVGMLQDTAAPFNTGVAGLIVTTALDQTGRLVVGGSYNNSSQITRYNVASSTVRSTSFNTTGARLGDFPGVSSINKVVDVDGTFYSVAGVSNSNQFTTGLYLQTNGSLSPIYGSGTGIVIESTLGPSQAYSILQSGARLAAVGFTNSTVPTVINYVTSSGDRDEKIGNRGVQTFGTFGSGTFYDIATVGSQRFGVGQGNSTAFINRIGNTAGIVQDTASPFNIGATGLVLTTVIDPAGKLVVGGSYGTNAQVTRYNVASSSVRDTSFNTDGVAINDLTTTAVINKIINATSNQYLVAGVSNTNQFTTALYANDGTLNSGYGSGGIVRETGVGVSQAYDMLLNGTALAVAGFINNNKAGVINYNATNGTPSSTLGDRGVQQFNTLGTAATLYGIATTTGTQRFGAGQSNSNLAFLQPLNNTAGVLQDTAAPFNTGANALLYTTTINQAGNVIVGGQYDSINTTWTVASYTPAGARNTSFNTNGVAVTPSGFDAGRVRAVMIDNAGRILATGTSRIGGSDENATTVRYNGAGTSSTTARETGFGVSSGLGLYINSDNSFEVAGFSTESATETPTVFSYDANLNLLNTDQFTTLQPGQFYAIQEADGNFFAAGSSVDTAILYPLLDGTGLLRDTAAPFDTGFSGRMFGGILDSDQKIVLCGNYNNVFTVIKYNLNASRNTDFNTDGVVQLPVLNAATGYAVAQDSAGDYYIAAESTVSGTIVFTLVKISNTGELEFVVQETGLGIGRAKAVKINVDGTVLVGGQTTVNGVLLPTIVAYTADGQKISTFGTNGVQIFSTYGTGSLEGLSVINIATVAAAGQTTNRATVVEFGQSNNFLNQITTGF